MTNAFRIPPEVSLVQSVSSGSAPVNSIHNGSGFYLLHGGAGPADPKGSRALLARDAVERIARGVRQAHTGHVIGDFQVRALETRSFTSAERVALGAARALEEEPLFNAGVGSALQGDGVARASAGYMDSTRRVLSAVANVECVARPSELACYLQNQRFTCLDGLGSGALARNLGVPRTDLVTPQRFERWVELRREALEKGSPSADGKGTIGCVSLDADLRLCAITSTGGVGNETPGRVGDTPTVAGNYCTERVAVSCTGFGEQILALAFAARLATRVDDGMSLDDAMRRGIAEAHAREYGLAAIAVSLSADRTTATWCTGTTEGYFIWAGFDGTRALLFG